MGSQAVTGDKVGVLRQSRRYAAVKVHRSGDEHVGSHHFPDTHQQVSFRILYSLHAHCPVDVKKEPI